MDSFSKLSIFICLFVCLLPLKSRQLQNKQESMLEGLQARLFETKAHRGDLKGSRKENHNILYSVIVSTAPGPSWGFSWHLIRDSSVTFSLTHCMHNCQRHFQRDSSDISRRIQKPHSVSITNRITPKSAVCHSGHDLSPTCMHNLFPTT